MKNSKFVHAGLILILLSACQARKTQIQNASTATGTQTGALTQLQKPNDVTKLTIHDSSIGTGVDYVITSTQVESKNIGYQIEIVTKDESGANVSSKQIITEKSAAQLFHAIDSIFTGKVKISPTEMKDEQGDDKVVASIMITVASGTNQTTVNPALQGEGAESLLEDLAKLSQASRDDAQPTEGKIFLKFSQLSVDVVGGGNQSSSATAYAISSQDENTYLIQVSAYQFKTANASIQVSPEATEAFQAISQILSGKLAITEPTLDPKQGMIFGGSTIVKLTSTSGESTAITNPQLNNEAVSRALDAIERYIGEKLSASDGNIVPRTDAQADATSKAKVPACQALNLTGVWEAYLVAQGQVITVTSSIQAGAAAADGSQTFTGTDSANGNTSKRSYIYHTQTCVLEKTLDNNQKKYLKATVINNVRQRVKLVPCTDVSCTRYDPYPVYTDAVILNRVK